MEISEGGDVLYQDLFDIENRPGSGVRVWGKAVADQVERVWHACDRHRLGHVPDQMQLPEGVERLQSPDPEAERRLHTEVYFLALSIRRVLLFHNAISKQIDDTRLQNALRTFLEVAPQAKSFRDFFEHLDEYLLGKGKEQKRRLIGERISPVLWLSWFSSNVVVEFADERLDITQAGGAAAELAKTSGEIWEEHLERTRSRSEPPPTDDGVKRMMNITLSKSTVIGSPEEGSEITTGVFQRLWFRNATPREIENWSE